MRNKGMKFLAGVAALMSIVFVLATLAMTGAVNLPGHLRTELGLAHATPNPPCRLGLYREEPAGPAPTGHWRFEPGAPRAAVEGSAVAIGPVIYATNGSYPGDLHRLLAFDTRTGTWSEPAQMPIGLNHSQAATYKGDLYLAGGYLDGNEPTNEFWRYDPEADEWTELPPMVKPRGAAATAVVGDKLYVAGGAPKTFGVTAEGSAYGTLEIFDFETGRWSEGPEMPVPRHHLVGTGLDGKLYVVGGRAGLLDTNNNEPPVGEFDVYDPDTKKWTRLPEIPFASGYSGIAAAAGKVVVVGGENQSHWEDGGGWTTPTAWAYDPKTNEWQRLPDLHIERRGMGAAATAGRIYVAMGSYCPGLKPTGPVGTHTVESLPFSALQ